MVFIWRQRGQRPWAARTSDTGGVGGGWRIVKLIKVKQEGDCESRDTERRTVPSVHLHPDSHIQTRFQMSLPFPLSYFPTFITFAPSTDFYSSTSSDNKQAKRVPQTLLLIAGLLPDLGISAAPPRLSPNTCVFIDTVHEGTVSVQFWKVTYIQCSVYFREQSLPEVHKLLVIRHVNSECRLLNSQEVMKQ